MFHVESNSAPGCPVEGQPQIHLTRGISEARVGGKSAMSGRYPSGAIFGGPEVDADSSFYVNIAKSIFSEGSR